MYQTWYLLFFFFQRLCFAYYTFCMIMQMHDLYCQHLCFHLLWCIQNQNQKQYIGKVIVIICRFYQEKYQIANTLESICIFSSQDDGWGLQTQRCDKAPTFANFKSSKALFVESTFLVLVLVDKDGGIYSLWRTKSPLIFQWCWNARERLLWLPDLLLPLNFSLSKHFSSIWLSNALLRPPYCWSTCT